MPEDIVITTADMYALLVKVDQTVSAMRIQHEQQSQQLIDHEARLRSIEAEEDFSRRFTEMEAEVKAVRQDLIELQRKVWAIPGASVLISAGILITTLVIKF